MSNPFKKVGQQMNQPNGAPNFFQFMASHRGENADELLPQVIQQFGLTQDQLNMVQTRKAELEKKLEPMRKMFGF